ncbi:MAG: site-2 protease family protein, partial [Candidatus Latescibacterota bacterium]
NRIVRANPGRELAFTIARDGSRITVPITPAEESDQKPDGSAEKIGRIGVKIQTVNREVGPGEALVQAVDQTWYYAVNTFGFFVKLVTGQMSPKLLGGPVMIAELAGESARSGFVTLMGFTAFISVNLAVLNLLPFPVLDGGHIFITLVESVTRRKLSIRARTVLQQVGTLVLLFLMFYVTFNDVMRIDIIGRLFGKN